jgi:uncharacterized protein YraI
MFHRTLATAIVGLGLGIGVPVAANAYPAHTTGHVNMRVAPTTHSHRITTLGAGARVDVGRCRPGWCSVNYRGRSGWVASSYLTGQRAPMYQSPRASWYHPAWRDNRNHRNDRYHSRDRNNHSGFYYRQPGFGFFFGH